MSTAKVQERLELIDRMRRGGESLEPAFHERDVRALLAEVGRLKTENQDLRMTVKEMDLMFGRTLLGMRGAVIEWQRGHGADAGMQWIWNGLEGPGELPPDEEIQAQAYFDREVVKIEEGLEEVYAYRDKRRSEKAQGGI
ncbi:MULTISPECIES: hypothetical protein [Pseudomonas]|uniref:Uncharacterized protein n=1 Tax=Pseudomonas putida TaxID=303 RepID=A0A1L7NEZ8_PSEPU|nr:MULTISPECIES: hypothetical protein [Pseudomonas]MBP2091713.1 hypothetical protein [Pseudomonas sp. PvP088]MBP2222124.1 hypothetical protein [Pseudomonas putida]BAW23982.1 Uncharacterized protein KF715C_ch34090 [Pseudomonas putida]